ncbi:hypothetical protein [Mucilaginibacter pallidiroseus]|uniref:hypothetical protein n=1 Tax=Mucilaginibacter pallidiroseus TaxID=2599295 RepID=UPI0016480362|nr:hypothetical protein [Mucilaginibacter pallidiroseus]
MKITIEKLKTDLYKVFVKGDADSAQLARIYLLIAIPVITAGLMLSKLPIYG